MIGEQFRRWLLRICTLNWVTWLLVNVFTSRWQIFLPFTNELKGVVNKSIKNSPWNPGDLLCPKQLNIKTIANDL